jgi:hypothetical protein
MLRFVLIAWLALCGVASAQLSGGVGGFPGPGTVHSAAAGFTGPGDVVSGAYAWYSCSRGYNTADTANACNVCLPADTTCADLTLSAGFAVVPGSLSTCNITTVICTVKTAYDKTGNGRDMTQATEANRPTFRPAMASNNCPTTALPCMLFVAASSQRLVTAGTFTLSQPITASAVFNRTAAAIGQELFGFGVDVSLFQQNSNTIALMVGGSAGTPTAAATDGSWHAIQGVVSGASSNAYVDGATTAVSAGTGSVAAKGIKLAGPAFVANIWGGYIAEVGMWNSAFNATQAGNMNTNQHGANGYNF